MVRPPPPPTAGMEWNQVSVIVRVLALARVIVVVIEMVGV